MLNAILSFIVFSILDVVDFILCYAYKAADYVMEAEWKQAASSNKILQMSEQGESKILRLTNCASKLQLEEISDTLYTRPSFLADLSKSSIKLRTPNNRRSSSTTFTVNSTVVEMLQGKIGSSLQLPIPRWSDCHCNTCTSWITTSCKQNLFVKADGAIGTSFLIIRFFFFFF